MSALQLAVQAGHRDTARLLLAAGAPPDAVSLTGETALVWAARTGDELLVRELLAAGALAGRRLEGVTPAYWAAAAGHTELAAGLDRAATGE